MLATNWTEKDLRGWKTRLLYLILFFIPKANPGNEKSYHLVDKWLLELDDNLVPQREVALDKNGKLQFVAPDDKNFGFWTE